MKRMMMRRSIFRAVGGGAGLLALDRERTLAEGTTESTGDMSSNSNIALVRQWIDEVVNGGRLDAADEIFAPTYISHPDGGTVGTVKRTAARWRGGSVRGYAALEDIVASGDRVAVRVTWHAAARPAPFARARSERRTALGVAIFRIADGRIAEGWGLTEGARLT